MIAATSRLLPLGTLAASAAPWSFLPELRLCSSHFRIYFIRKSGHCTIGENIIEIRNCASEGVVLLQDRSTNTNTLKVEHKPQQHHSHGAKLQNEEGTAEHVACLIHFQMY